MPVTWIRQLQPRSRPAQQRPPDAGPRPRPAHPSAPLRTTLALTGSVLLVAGVVALTLLVRQLWWLDVVAAERSTVLITTARAGFVTAADPSQTPAAGGSGPRSPVPAPERSADPGVTAIVHLPTLDEVQPVLEGVGTDVLDQGVLGHYPGTAGPGEEGTYALAGHRTTYGRPLWALQELRAGDPVVVETASSYLVYEVRSLQVVGPQEVSVLAPAPHPDDPAELDSLLVLTTCHPRFSAAQRLVARAVLARSVPRTEGAPVELAG